MKDAGYVHKSIGGDQPTAASESSRKVFPSSTIDHRSMPHMKNHKGGDTGEMHIKYKVNSQHQYRDGSGDTGIDITHYEPHKKGKKAAAGAKQGDDEAAEGEE